MSKSDFKLVFKYSFKISYICVSLKIAIEHFSYILNMSVKSHSRIHLILAIVLLNVGLDQISKYAVRSTIAKDEIIGLLFDTILLKNINNSGAALGIGYYFFTFIFPNPQAYFNLFSLSLGNKLVREVYGPFRSYRSHGSSRVHAEFIRAHNFAKLEVFRGFVYIGRHFGMF